MFQRLALGFCLSVASAGIAASGAEARSLYTEPKYAAMLINAYSGEVLYARQADAQRFPASITKVMTLYIAFEELAGKRLRLDDRITVSPFAAARPPSKLGLKAGSTISVRDAINVIATKSANDIAVALAEHLAGSEEAFAARMTATARRLNMKSTTFRNASGLPNAGHVTTARDIATLSRAVILNFPQNYNVFSQVTVDFEGQQIGSHNHLLRTLPGVDGIKTGYTGAAGFTLAASAAHDGVRLIAVVLGGPNRLARDGNVTNLLDTGFHVLTKRSRGEETTVAANFAEPEDLSDGVLERLSEMGSGDEAALATVRIKPRR